MQSAETQTILLVDDHPTFLGMLAMQIEECSDNICVLTAENGEKALEVLESAQVDMVVTDLKMPVMDGYELISRLKENYPCVPVIVMSFFLCPELEGKLRSSGICGCIDKQSISPTTLREMVFQSLSEVRSPPRGIHPAVSKQSIG